ncbi:Response regulator receiver domain-containing protein [Hymenobacter gelipurpurascens]|uniref:Response regulator receiver domain-containing protein n=2 Tax=Hymenobacter gelipurpurascens TaxID=89968 RepID=A0A212TCX2_9BACT|nr:Response regulator receiver domain-containing protein [Hymenobacter gelipurpurascens]
MASVISFISLTSRFGLSVGLYYAGHLVVRMQKLTCTMLVDDDQTTNYLNRKLLERLAISDRILVAHNGQEALDILTNTCHHATPSCPVLIFLDIKMPVMNGFEFMEAYLQLPLAQQHSIIIVILTTSLHPVDMQRISQLPVSGFLSKPLSREHIDSVLQEHFARQLPA